MNWWISDSITRKRRSKWLTIAQDLICRLNTLDCCYWILVLRDIYFLLWLSSHCSDYSPAVLEFELLVFFWCNIEVVLWIKMSYNHKGIIWQRQRVRISLGLLLWSTTCLRVSFCKVWRPKSNFTKWHTHLKTRSILPLATVTKWVIWIIQCWETFLYKVEWFQVKPDLAAIIHSRLLYKMADCSRPQLRNEEAFKVDITFNGVLSTHFAEFSSRQISTLPTFSDIILCLAPGFGTDFSNILRLLRVTHLTLSLSLPSVVCTDTDSPTCYDASMPPPIPIAMHGCW